MPLETPTPLPTRPLRIRLLLWFADWLYDFNSWAFDVVGRASVWWSVFCNNRYTDVATWCWKVLVTHSTTEEVIVVGNRRLAKYGLQLTTPKVQSVPTQSAWDSPAIPYANKSELN